MLGRRRLNAGQTQERGRQPRPWRQPARRQWQAAGQGHCWSFWSCGRGRTRRRRWAKAVLAADRYYGAGLLRPRNNPASSGPLLDGDLV